ncbi:MAG: hypothetical protein HXS41_12550 [Theionarchaea archaeon]|nr:hypothetical protein [Theionarchaea archaeon]MBU7001422.1 hypothetical protein [Theionarchaea archaeon]MBU7021883.1 hypothetical protein [Theionarchaea archaeon]MBU7034335.1 hypothetical protein [Theionarchaea archaeon]MBU7040300.1 hypothetical protein [Theionarchaea archaeon]
MECKEEKNIKTFEPTISTRDSIKRVERVGLFKRLTRRGNSELLRGIESKLVYYPFWFFTFDVRVHRAFRLPDKKVMIPVAVDAVSGKAGFLEANLGALVDKTVEKPYIIPYTVEYSNAVNIAEQFCKLYVNREYHPFSLPDYILMEYQLIHPPYFAVNSTNEPADQHFLVLVNGITGSVEQKEEILLD